jgi:hypothetical protein
MSEDPWGNYPGLETVLSDATQENLDGYPGKQGEDLVPGFPVYGQYPLETYPNKYGYGDVYIKWGISFETTTFPIFETVLIIGSEDNTTFTVTPISGKFPSEFLDVPDPSDPLYPGTLGDWSDLPIDTIPITEEDLPVPENVWQIATVGDRILVLMDFRPSYEASPRPCLRCYNIDGELECEYLTLVAQSIQDEVYTSDTVIDRSWYYDDNTVYTGSAKWFFHGRQDLYSGGNFFAGGDPSPARGWGDTPGPRMKVTFPGAGGRHSGTRIL